MTKNWRPKLHSRAHRSHGSLEKWHFKRIHKFISRSDTREYNVVEQIFNSVSVRMDGRRKIEDRGSWVSSASLWCIAIKRKVVKRKKMCKLRRKIQQKSGRSRRHTWRDTGVEDTEVLFPSKSDVTDEEQSSLLAEWKE